MTNHINVAVVTVAKSVEMCQKSVFVAELVYICRSLSRNVLGVRWFCLMRRIAHFM
jgi:hypothetical protein